MPSTKPSWRARPVETSCGPARCAIRRWPSETRCSTASRAPAWSSAVAEGRLPSSTRRLTSTSGTPDAAISSSSSWSERAVAATKPSTWRARIASRSTPLALRVVVGVGDQRRVAGLAEPVVEAADDRREERVLDVGHEHADRVAAVRLQPARERVRPVAELLRHLPHAPHGLVAHERLGLRVQRARDGAGVHAGHPRHVAQRRARRHVPGSAISTAAASAQPPTHAGGDEHRRLAARVLVEQAGDGRPGEQPEVAGEAEGAEPAPDGVGRHLVGDDRGGHGDPRGGEREQHDRAEPRAERRRRREHDDGDAHGEQAGDERRLARDAVRDRARRPPSRRSARSRRRPARCR